jgi:hypothetical protein
VLLQPVVQVLSHGLRAGRNTFARHRVGLHLGELLVDLIPGLALDALADLAPVSRDDVGGLRKNRLSAHEYCPHR